jgi:hypothetical protein
MTITLFNSNYNSGTSNYQFRIFEWLSEAQHKGADPTMTIFKLLMKTTDDKIIRKVLLSPNDNDIGLGSINNVVELPVPVSLFVLTLNENFVMSPVRLNRLFAAAKSVADEEGQALIAASVYATLTQLNNPSTVPSDYATRAELIAFRDKETFISQLMKNVREQGPQFTQQTIRLCRMIVTKMHMTLDM